MLQIAESSLCTLTKLTISSEGHFVNTPIARSYNGKEWEQAAGEFAHSFFDGPILCYSKGCQVHLPKLEAGYYLLTSSTHSLSDRNTYARFLETATFGITEKELDDLESRTSSRSGSSVESNIISWVHEQMDTAKTPMTSHREFWRRGLNGRVSSDLFFEKDSK